MKPIDKNVGLTRRFIQVAKDTGFRRALLSASAYGINLLRSRANYIRFALRSRSPQQLRQRIEILRRFRTIHKSVHCAHSEDELLFIADEILRIPSDRGGDIIECGVYKGGSTCKLSVVAKLVGRRVIACDSFLGLPRPKDFDATHVHSNGIVEVYEEADYLGSLDEVYTNLSRFGEPSVVSLVPGWFHESLPRLRRDQKFVCIFLDVDLQESIVCCLQNLWPRLQVGCKLFTHEAHHELTVKVFSDEAFWRTNFGHDLPPFIGAGTGLGPTMPALGHVEKPPDLL